jgi:hypothetical protein
VGGHVIDDKTNAECKIAVEAGVKAITHIGDDRRNSRVIFISAGKNVGGAPKDLQTAPQMRFPHLAGLLEFSCFDLYY